MWKMSPDLTGLYVPVSCVDAAEPYGCGIIIVGWCTWLLGRYYYGGCLQLFGRGKVVWVLRGSGNSVVSCGFGCCFVARDFKWMSFVRNGACRLGSVALLPRLLSHPIASRTPSKRGILAGARGRGDGRQRALAV